MTTDTKPEILVIDDDDSVRESFCSFLEDQRYTLLQAANGRIGLELFEARKPDLVLVDLRMPEVDGHQVLEQISTTSPDTPLIVVSGTGRIQDVVKALQLGAWNYLLKPVTDLTMLSHAVTNALERARLLKENRNYQHHLEEEVERRTQEFALKVEEMTRFNRMAIGRERRIIELKRQINALREELGRDPKYSSPDLIETDHTFSD